MEKIKYVFGHKNPDTDSICSAIAYAHLKRALGYEKTIAARLGKVSRETKYALDYFGVKEPILIDNVKPQVGDMDYYKVAPIYVVDAVKKAWDIMTKNGRPMAPILYPDHKLAGIVSLSDIAKAYIGLTDGTVLKRHRTPFVNIAAVLEGKIIHGSYPEPYVGGDVYTTASITKKEKLNALDILITGSNEDLIQVALQSGAGCVIITDQESGMNQIKIPKGCECAIMTTECTFFSAIRMIAQSISVTNLIGKKDIIYFSAEETIDEVKEVMLNTSHRHFPIVNQEGQVQGVISKRHILDVQKKQVILVDHNEKSQSVNGIEQAEILEIIDHHRVANIDTGTPVYLRAEPVGCTSTIVAKMYDENNIMPPREIAGLMLSAILSDTLIFKSPTCTPVDVKMANRLAKIAEVDLNEYGRELIAAGTSLEGISPRDLLYIDKKQFTLGKYNAVVAQINTSDFSSIFQKKDEILEEMRTMAQDEKLHLVVLLVTDLILGGTELFAIGSEKWLAEQAFGLAKEDDSVFLRDVYSRKKQIIPKLMMSTQANR